MIRWLTEDVAVAGQIRASDVTHVAAMGFKSIMCNRPDGEAPGQPVFSEIDKAAETIGMDTRFVPVISGQATRTDVEKFAAALSELPKPVLVYCRSGTRSAHLSMAAQSLR